MHTPCIAHPQKAYREQYSCHPLLPQRSFVYALLALLMVSSCKDQTEPQPALPQGPTVATASIKVPVMNRMGRPIALFLFTQTTTTAPSGPATAVLGVRVQNVSSCTLSFPYTITVSSQGPGQLVNQEFSGTVTNLPVEQVIQVHNAAGTPPFNLHKASIIITPHAEPIRTECPSLVGNWTGPYALIAENTDDDWEYGRVTKYEENGDLYVTVPAAGGPLEIRYVGLTGTRPPPGFSTSLVGTLSPDYEFSGQGLVRSDAGNVVDTVKATGLLRKLAALDPLTGKQQLSVELQLKYARSPSDFTRLKASAKL